MGSGPPKVKWMSRPTSMIAGVHSDSFSNIWHAYFRLRTTEQTYPTNRISTITTSSKNGLMEAAEKNTRSSVLCMGELLGAKFPEINSRTQRERVFWYHASDDRITKEGFLRR